MIKNLLKNLKNLLKGLTLKEIIIGLSVTGKHLWRRKITLLFPKEVAPISPRFRGLHALRRYSNGEERCIACKLCETACPANAITIESQMREDGTRRTTRYDIDLFKCIYCGFCEEACPTDAIVETNIMHYAFFKADKRNATKSDLLKTGDQYENQIAKDRQLDSQYR